MADKILGIHLASSALKVVELEQQEQGLKVINWAVKYFPPGTENVEDAQAKALTAVSKKNKIEIRDASLTLSGADLVYKLVDLPVLPEKEIDAALRYKLESVSPLSLENICLDYYKLGELQKDNQQIFFTVTIPKERVIKAINIALKVGLNVKEIIPSSSALMNAAAVAEKEPYVLVYFGKCSTIIVLVKHGEVVFAREVAVGGDRVTQSLVGAVQTEEGRLEFEYAKAEELKNSFGIPLDLEAFTEESHLPAAEILAMMRPVLEELEAEILRTFEYYRMETGDQIEFVKAYFSGGASKTRNFLEYFSLKLGIPVEHLPLAVGSDLPDFPENASLLSLAVGAA